jgi:fructokinase
MAAEAVDEAILISALTCERIGADPPFLAARPTRNPGAPLTAADLVFMD